MGKTRDLFKKIRDTKGTFHAKMGSIKDRNDMDLTEQKILIRGGKNTQAAVAAKSLQLCSTLCNPIDGSPQAPPSLGFSRQEHWSGLPFPSPMHESEK